MILLFAINLFMCSSSLSSQEYRFPQPEFSENYQYPELNPVNPETWFVPWMDLIFLVAALVISFFLLYKFRSRTGLFIVSVLSLVYLGFIRKGCVCPVGSTQPVLQSLFDSSLILPVTTLLVFLIPLITALFWGRIFCGSVCPLGALQELLAKFNGAMPKPVSSVLKVIPPAYLILAGVSALTGSDYLICRFDPFVRLFRLNLNSVQLPLTVVFLILSVVIYRPYCRFICPYGWLLAMVSRLSLFKVRAVEHNCINCGLCESSCPADAVTKPETKDYPAKENRKKLRLILVILPFTLLLAAFSAYTAAPLLFPVNRDISMYRALTNPLEENSLERDAFWGGDISFEELEISALKAEAMWMKGIIIGSLILVLIIFGEMVLSLRNRKQNRYEADPAECLNCGRCYQACPKERVRKEGLPLKEELES